MDGLEDFRDLQGNNVNEFIRAYRDELKNDYDANVSNIQQQKRNDFASIMAQANKAGMMYSNFPERSKLRYEAETYLPNRQKAYTSYQTGLDKLRSNALSSYNTLKNLQDQIKDLDESNPTTANKTVGDFERSGIGTQFTDAEGNPIRFSTWAINNGATDNKSLLEAAQKSLSTAQYNQLKRIVDAQASTKHPNLKRNTGSAYKDMTYSFLSPEDSAFLNSLGLGF